MHNNNNLVISIKSTLENKKIIVSGTVNLSLVHSIFSQNNDRQP